MEMSEHDLPRINPRDKSYINTLPPNAPKISGSIGGILTRLFNIVCYDITGGKGISPIRWNNLMKDYVRVASENNSGHDRSSIRGNTNKQLHKPQMTWNVLFKGLQFLKFEAFTIGICGEVESGLEFNAYTSVSFVGNTRFAKLFPKELPLSSPVQRTGVIASRASRRGYSNLPGGVLSKLFALICLALTDNQGYTQAQWNELVDQFITVNDSEEDSVKIKKLNDKSNLNKEFRLPKMTWRVFCKALQFLKVTKFTLYITAYREDGMISDCETSSNFAPNK